MKKILLATMVLLFASQQVLAEKARCHSRRGCHHRGGPSYSDGVFDGLFASSLILMTSDDLSNDYSRDFLESEISFTLNSAVDGQLVLSNELQALVDDTRELNQQQDLTDEEILEAYLLLNE